MMLERVQGNLLKLAGAFLTLFAIILSLSPAVRERTWNVSYRWQHWAGLLAWILVFALAQKILDQYFPDRDQFLLPIAALLTGWGLLTIWRLTPAFGLRQTIWMVITLGVITFIFFRLPFKLEIIRRYKYLILTGGLLLTSLTLLFGSNPAGEGPRLWLGCCGIYLQPSEPLKLLLVGYLAAYLADRLPARDRIIPLLTPTLFVTGLALLLLLVQRDLGTASIFILLYATIVFIALGRKRILLISIAMLFLAGLAGYFLIDLIQIRVDAWFNPWLDPSGRSYQIIQSLLATANGGIFGRGPGLGSPSLVPIAHSDFIFTSIAEETGLVGVVALLALYAVLVSRGLRIAILATDHFKRIIAAGITAYFSIQSLLIIGGNLRILPLTGVTLPFVSYGGSSLFTSFFALFILLAISNQVDEEPAPLRNPFPYNLLGAIVSLGLFTMALGMGWWTLARGTDLLERTDNARRAISDRYVLRGGLYDREASPINITEGETGNLTRKYLIPNLGPVVGYTHPVYGQAGLEASLDDYLRGLQGNPASQVWWDRLLYGTPPTGLDVRLSLDLNLQNQADRLLADSSGAILMLNASTGEILLMASKPGFDPNLLDEIGATLASEQNAPLLNRATQGNYPPAGALEPFSQILLKRSAPASPAQEYELYRALGFYETPRLRLPITPAAEVSEQVRVNPMQMALAAAALSNGGLRPAPRIALAVNTPQQDWVILPALAEPNRILPEGDSLFDTVQFLALDNPYWRFTGVEAEPPLTWHLAGTLPEWSGTPLVLVILLEEENPSLADQIGAELLAIALKY